MISLSAPSLCPSLQTSCVCTSVSPVYPREGSVRKRTRTPWHILPSMPEVRCTREQRQAKVLVSSLHEQSPPWRCTCAGCGASTRKCTQQGGSTDDTSHPIPPIVSCRAAPRDLSRPQRRRCHTQGTRQHIQSRCAGCPGTGRAAADVSPWSGSFDDKHRNGSRT